MSNINFKKPIIEKKYLIKFEKFYDILFFQKDLGYPELGENRAPLKTRLYLLFQNGFLIQMKLKIQFKEVRKVIQVL